MNIIVTVLSVFFSSSLSSTCSQRIVVGVTDPFLPLHPVVDQVNSVNFFFWQKTKLKMFIQFCGMIQQVRCSSMHRELRYGKNTHVLGHA